MSTHEASDFPWIFPKLLIGVYHLHPSHPSRNVFCWRSLIEKKSLTPVILSSISPGTFFLSGMLVEIQHTWRCVWPRHRWWKTGRGKPQRNRLMSQERRERPRFREDPVQSLFFFIILEVGFRLLRLLLVVLDTNHCFRFLAACYKRHFLKLALDIENHHKHMLFMLGTLVNWRKLAFKEVDPDTWAALFRLEKVSMQNPAAASKFIAFCQPKTGRCWRRFKRSIQMILSISRTLGKIEMVFSPWWNPDSKTQWKAMEALLVGIWNPHAPCYKQQKISHVHGVCRSLLSLVISIEASHSIFQLTKV